MSSSIDYITCPKCGSTGAYREQDNKTCEITYGCPNCNWNGEAVENDEIFEPKKTKKKGLLFTCPDCEEHHLGLVEKVIVTYPITHISANGNLDYDYHQPRIAGDGEVVAYQCMDCGYELTDEKGNTITDWALVAKWVKKHCKKK